MAKRATRKKSKNSKKKGYWFTYFLRLFSFGVVMLALVVQFQNCMGATSGDCGAWNLGNCASTFYSPTPSPGGSASVTTFPTSILVPTGQSQGTTNVVWTSSAVAVRVLVNGVQVSQGLGSDSKSIILTTKGANRLDFIDAANAQNVLATTFVTLSEVPYITINSNPIPAANFSQAIVQWFAPTVTTVEIHVNGPGGTLWLKTSGTGSAPIGSVANGTKFYLQNADSGTSTSAANTLGIAQVNIQN